MSWSSWLQFRSSIHPNATLVAALAKREVRILVLRQQRLACTRMWLMADLAVDLNRYFGEVVYVPDVLHWMTRGRVSLAVLHLQDCDFVLGEVVFRKPDFTIEDRNLVGIFQLRWLAVSTVALHAKHIAFGAEQLLVVSAVGLVTGRAALLKCWLMQRLLGFQVGYVGMTSRAS